MVTPIQEASVGRAFAMNSRESLGGSGKRPVLTLKQIELPINVILRLAKFLRFEDFHNFVRALWPKMNECGAIRAELWRSSVHNLTMTFINRKELNIRYNFNRYRNIKNRILVARDSLLPIFGGVILPTMSYFSSMSEIDNFVKMHVHLNKCSNYRYASCPCHLPSYDGGRRNTMVQHFTGRNCGYGHFHHYCANHVLYWLHFYLAARIGFRGSEAADARFADRAHHFLMFLDEIVHFQEDRVRLGSARR